MADAPSPNRGGAPLVYALFAALVCCAPLRAAEQPLWEVGLGIGVLGYNNYRGADTSHVYPVPVPYVVYNGPFLTADQEGVHGTLFSRPWVEVNLSFDATTPVSNGRVRSGMPELKPTVEFGGMVDFHLWRSEDSRIRLDLWVPLRQAFTLQGPPQPIGWTLTPGFKLKIADPWGHEGWHVSIYTDPLFANRHYDNYFYTVETQYASTSRPAFQAAGGYAGTQFVANVMKRFPHYWVGAYVRYDTLTGAVFGDSPLVQRNHYWTAAFGIAWMIGKSSRTVEVEH